MRFRKLCCFERYVNHFLLRWHCTILFVSDHWKTKQYTQLQIPYRDNLLIICNFPLLFLVVLVPLSLALRSDSNVLPPFWTKDIGRSHSQQAAELLIHSKGTFRLASTVKVDAWRSCDVVAVLRLSFFYYFLFHWYGIWCVLPPYCNYPCLPSGAPKNERFGSRDPI
jgi:hypothetical protein